MYLMFEGRLYLLGSIVFLRKYVHCLSLSTQHCPLPLLWIYSMELLRNPSHLLFSNGVAIEDFSAPMSSLDNSGSRDTPCRSRTQIKFHHLILVMQH